MLRYSPWRGRVQPFLEAGVVLSRVMSAKTAFAVEITPGSIADVTYFPNNEVQKYDVGLSAGAGVSTAALAGRRLSLALRFERSSGPSNDTAIGTEIHHASVLLGLDLTKPRVLSR